MQINGLRVTPTHELYRFIGGACSEEKAAVFPKPTLNSTPMELPPLPEPAGAIDVDEGPAGAEYPDGARVESTADGFTADQMRAYAEAAVLQERAKQQASRTGFMCEVDFSHELGAAAGGTKVYPDLEDLREQRRCVSGGCGIVEVRVEFVRVVQPTMPDCSPPGAAAIRGT